jgi:predicted HTH transcriptional regulator
MSDIDPVAVDDYRQQRRAINPDAEELAWSNDDLLRSLGCVKPDNGQLKPTVAGIVLFGSTMALRRCFPMMRIDYIRVPGRRCVENPHHRFDMLEICNPGHSIKAEEQLGEPGSETRNPRIAAVLHEVNIAETKGSGIRAMRELMLAQDLLPPTFESSRRPD